MSRFHHRFFFLVTIIVFQVGLFAAEQSDAEKRRDIIRYGLESDVTALVQTLQDTKDDSCNAELADVFKRTKSPTLKESILGFFTSRKDPALKDYSLSLLADPYDATRSTVLADLSYVQAINLTEAAPLVRKMLEGDNADYRVKAITTLGKIGSAEDAGYLLKYMSGDLEGDEKQRLIIRQTVMDALGELKAMETWDQLASIVKDKDENAMIRATAATAIGKMQKPEAIPVLTEIYGESDPVIRGAAIEGLGNFHTPESDTAVIEGLKDSYYKVRLTALDAVAKQSLSGAVPYVTYRAKTDPVEAVQLRAYEVLGKLRDASSDEWLLGILRDEKASDLLRTKAAAVLLENNRSFVQADFEKAVMQTVKDDKRKGLRYAFGKIVIDQSVPGTGSVAAAFLSSKDTQTKAIGLSMYEKLRYPELTATVEAIAADAKQGELGNRAKKILGAAKVEPATP